MTNADQLAELRARGLLPFQVNFVLEFLDPDSSAVWELASPVGTGKTRLGLEIARCVLEERDDARVLFTAPRALVGQWTENLKRDFTNTVFVDRRKFMELSATVKRDQPPWPEHATIVMSIDFAKREDISSALRAVEWDLIVADESHLLTGKRADLFFGMLAEGRAKRGLMLTTLATKAVYPHDVEVSGRTISRADVVGWQGEPVLARKIIREVIHYRPSEEEQAVLSAAKSVAKKLSSVSPKFALQARTLLQVTFSSLYAGERFAWGLGKRITHAQNLGMHGLARAGSDVEGPDDDESPAVEREASKGMAPLSSAAMVTLTAVKAELEALLLRFEDIPGDSKLQVLMQYLGQLEAETEQFHVCIWTRYLTTIEYLATALEKLELPISKVIGPMSYEERMQAVEQFEARGGILLVTDAAFAEGIDVSFVDECIHYDLPYDPRRLEQRVGRFLQLGRKKQSFRSISIHASERGLAWEDHLFRQLAKASTLIDELGEQDLDDLLRAMLEDG